MMVGMILELDIFSCFVYTRLLFLGSFSQALFHFLVGIFLLDEKVEEFFQSVRQEKPKWSLDINSRKMYYYCVLNNPTCLTIFAYDNLIEVMQLVQVLL